MLRPRYCIANWKMNLTVAEGKEYFSKWINKPLKNSGIKTIFCPSFTALFTIAKILKDSDSGLGAQNVYYEQEGAYTGEVSCTMLKDVGCRWVIIGHSERRTIFNETDKLIQKKLQNTLSKNLYPILCIGETKAERDSECTQAVLSRQLSILSSNFDHDLSRLVIAYEPIWAIGTGITASSDQAQEVHSFIRNIIGEKYGVEVAEDTSILYGGSCNPSNAVELFSQQDIDGGLIGGASLNANDFVVIANSF